MLKNYKISPFAYFYERNNVVCAYQSVKMSALYMDKKYYNEILTIINNPENAEITEKQNDIIKKLISNEILVNKSFSAEDYIKSILPLMIKPPHIRVMVLHMTDFCNLCCKYCFIEGNIRENYKRKNMTTEVIEKAIDKFVSLTENKKFKKRPAIVFYGGEPLANWEVLNHGLNYIANKYSHMAIDKIIITNGTLITKEIALELKKHGVGVSISIDGPKNCHDVNRVYRNGSGTFDDAVRGVKLLREAGIEPSASCVISKETVDKTEQVITWLVDELNITALGFNHVSIVPSLNYYSEEYENAFANSILKVQDMIQDKYPHVYERRMNHKINCYIDKQIIRADCTGCGEQFSVSTTGEVGICQGYMGTRKTFNNSVFDDDFDPNTDEVFIEWSQRSPYTMPECYSCPALSICGGGCPRNTDVLSGSIWKRDIPFCHFAKKAQEWLIWNQFDRQHGKVEYIK